MTENTEKHENSSETRSSEVGSVNATQSLQSLSSNNFIMWFGLVVIAFFITIFFTFKGSNSENIQSSFLFTVIFALIAFCGAIFSLIFSKQLAIKAHKIKLINPTSHENNQIESDLYSMVQELSQKAGLSACPAVGIYKSPDMNAFATGKNHNDSLVAFSTGLINAMPLNEIRAVAAHEIGHIANKDMLGTILIQGFLNAIVICFTLPLQIIRFIFNIASSSNNSFMYKIMDYAFLIIAFLVKIFLNFIGMLGALAFSRHREYKADKFASILVGAEDMSSALTRLSSDTETAPIDQSEYAAFKVSGKIIFAELFSTHPPIEKRIQALANAPSRSAPKSK